MALVKCRECGAEISDQAVICPYCGVAGGGRLSGYEYRSRRTLFGLPLVHVVMGHGVDPATGRPRVAKGFFAAGNVAVGVFALGGVAVGVVSFGGLALGLLALGGCAIGVGLALGGLAVGAVALGGCAVGYYALGGAAFGMHVFGAGLAR